MEIKKIKNRTDLAIFIAAVLAVLAAVNYLGSHVFGRIDMTDSKQYSITDATKRALREIDDIINVKVYFSNNLPPHMHSTVSNVRDILSEYKAYAGRKLRISWEDPAESEEAKRTAQALGIPEIQIQTFDKDKAQVMNAYLGIAILFEDKKEAIPVVQNLQNLEYDLTQALIKVARTSVPKIGFFSRDEHGDMPPDFRKQMNIPSAEENFAPLFQNLKNNYEIKTIDLSEGKSVDDEIRTLIVMGQGEMSERELYEIDQYFMRGGNLIVLADAVKVSFEQGVRAQVQESPILDMLEHYGVRVERNLILDPSCGQVTIPQNFGPFSMNVNVPYPYFVRIGQDGFNSTNPAVSSLSDVVFPWVSSLTLKVGESSDVSSSSDDLVATVLASSSPKSWRAEGHFDLNPQQQWAAPNESNTSSHTLAAHVSGNFKSFFDGKAVPSSAVEPAGDDNLSQISLKPDISPDKPFVSFNSGANLVVVGDGEFVTAQNATPNNIAFMLNTVDWLSLDNNLIAIRSRSLRDNTIERDLLKEGSIMPGVIRVANIFSMPLLMIIIGLFIFMKRKEKFAVAASPSNTEPSHTEKTEVKA